MILIIMIFASLYLYAAGITGKQINAIGQHRCEHRDHDWENCGHYYTGIIGGAFWPMAIPLALGMKSADAVPTAISKEMKVDKQRAEQLKAKQHDVAIEQQLVMEEEMINKRLALSVRRGEQEKRLLELSAAGVDTDRIENEYDDEPVRKSPSYKSKNRYETYRG